MFLKKNFLFSLLLQVSLIISSKFDVIYNLNWKSGGTCNPDYQWKVDCGKYDGALVGVYDIGFWAIFGDIDKVKCRKETVIKKKDCIRIKLSRRNDGGNVDSSLLWRTECPVNYAMTAIWDDDNGFCDVDSIKCCPIENAYINYGNCERKYMGFFTANGPYGVNQKWNVQCKDNFIAVSFWDDDDQYSDIDALKCCELVKGSGCEDEVIISLNGESGGVKKIDSFWNVDCTDGAMIGFYDDNNKFGDIDGVKCRPDTRINTEDCIKQKLRAWNDGGSSNPNDKWKTQCPNNKIITGIYDDNDRFSDVDLVKCCGFNSDASVTIDYNDCQKKNMNSLTDGGSYDCKNKWRVQCDNGYYAVAFYDDDDNYSDIDAVKCCRVLEGTTTSEPSKSPIITPRPTDTTPSPTSVTPSPTNATPSPTSVTPSPTSVTPSPTDATPEPTGVTPSPTSVTPSPTNATPSPTDTTPSPTTATPEPTGATPEPTGATPEPTGVTPSPTSVTPSPTSVTPSPTSATPEPTGATPEPTGVTPSPTDATPSPTSATPSPTDATASPTSNTPSPTTATPEPTGVTPEPSETPTTKPTEDPSKSPTLSPSETPTIKPTEDPSAKPTSFPSVSPTAKPVLSLPICENGGQLNPDNSCTCTDSFTGLRCQTERTAITGYFFISKKNLFEEPDWFEAKQLCLERGTDLAIFRTDADNQLALNVCRDGINALPVEPELSFCGCWVGAERFNDTTFQWVDKTLIPKSFFAPTQPLNDGQFGWPENCGHMFVELDCPGCEDGDLNDLACQFSVFCSKGGLPVVCTIYEGQDINTTSIFWAKHNKFEKVLEKIEIKYKEDKSLFDIIGGIIISLIVCIMFCIVLFKCGICNKRKGYRKVTSAATTTDIGAETSITIA